MLAGSDCEDQYDSIDNKHELLTMVYDHPLIYQRKLGDKHEMTRKAGNHKCFKVLAVHGGTQIEDITSFSKCSTAHGDK